MLRILRRLLALCIRRTIHRHRSYTQGGSQNGEYNDPYRSRPVRDRRKGNEGGRRRFFTDGGGGSSRGSREFDGRGRDVGHGRRLGGRDFDVGGDSRRERYREFGRRGEEEDGFDVRTDRVGDQNAMWGYEDEDTLPPYGKKSTTPYRHSDGTSGAVVDDSTQEDGTAGSRVGAVNRDYFFSMKVRVYGAEFSSLPKASLSFEAGPC